jgi:hypothetical protein
MSNVWAIYSTRLLMKVYYFPKNFCTLKNIVKKYFNVLLRRKSLKLPFNLSRVLVTSVRSSVDMEKWMLLMESIEKVLIFSYLIWKNWSCFENYMTFCDRCYCGQRYCKIYNNSIRDFKKTSEISELFQWATFWNWLIIVKNQLILIIPIYSNMTCPWWLVIQSFTEVWVYKCSLTAPQPWKAIYRQYFCIDLALGQHVLIKTFVNRIRR